MLSYTTGIRVRYADTDRMQIVWNGKYLEYFEVGRTEMLRFAGLIYSDLENAGYLLPVVESSVKHKSPATYDDLLSITTFVRDFPKLKIHIEYEIKNSTTGKLIATGFTDHVFLDKITKKVVRPPQFFIQTIKDYYDAELLSE
jgi:acyl-CoA thioester hydrolase